MPILATLPRLHVVTFVPSAIVCTGLKFPTGVSLILSRRICMLTKIGTYKTLAPSLLERINAKETIRVYVGPKDIAQSIAYGLASELATWAKKNSIAVEPSVPLFTVEVEYEN